jgi:pyrrolidone-carboxylate peptidase
VIETDELVARLMPTGFHKIVDILDHVISSERDTAVILLNTLTGLRENEPPI